MRLLGVIGLLLIIAIIGAAAFVFGGYYSVAATSALPGFVDAAIVQARVASIRHHATEAPPAGMSLTDVSVIQDGARAFASRGCTFCHGGPGVNWEKFSEGLNPGPPDLKEVAPNLDPRELFWVIRNGIGMTGMPSFANAGAPDEEIWKIVAFVKQLPIVTDVQFKMWTSAAGGQKP